MIGPRVLYLLFYGSQASWLPLFNVYLQQLGLSGLQIGILAGLRPALMLVGQPLGGFVADVWGRRRTLMVTMPLAGLLLLAYVYPGSYGYLLVVAAVYALISNPVGPLVDSVALDYLDQKPHVSYGQLRLFGAVGWAAGALLAGNLVTGRDIRIMFGLGAVLMLIAWGAAAVARHGQRESSTGGTWREARLLLGNRDLLTFLVVVALIQIGASSIFTFYSLYLKEIGATDRLIGVAYSLQGLSELPLYLAAAIIIKRIGIRRTLVTTFVITSGRLFLYSIVSVPWMAAGIELVHGLSFSLFLVAAVEYVNRQVPPEWRATGQSLFWASYFGLGSIVGNSLAGFLFDRMAIQSMYALFGWWVLAIAVIAFFVLKREVDAHS